MDMSQYSGDDLKKHNATWLIHRETMIEIYFLVKVGRYGEAHELWEQDIPHKDQIILNRATNKGGLWRPHERSIAVKGVDTSTGWQYGVEFVSEAIEH